MKTTTAIKAALKKANVPISQFYMSRSGIKNLGCATTGIEFEWKYVSFGEDKDTPTHHISRENQVLTLTSTLRTLGNSQDVRQENADACEAVLVAGGVEFKREGNTFTLPTFTRVVETSYGKKSPSGGRYKTSKRVLANA